MFSGNPSPLFWIHHSFVSSTLDSSLVRSLFSRTMPEKKKVLASYISDYAIRSPVPAESAVGNTYKHTTTLLVSAPNFDGLRSSFGYIFSNWLRIGYV